MATSSRSTSSASTRRRGGPSGPPAPAEPEGSALRVLALGLFVTLAVAWLGAQTSPSTGSATAGDAAAGETLFFGKAECATCHEVNGRGGVTGPDLSDAGRMSEALLRYRIVDPNGRTPAPDAGRGRAAGRGAAAGPSTIVAKTKDGREIRGVRRNEDTFTVQIVDGRGQLHLLDKLALASVSVEPTSLMPADFATRLTSAEIDHVVAYLRTLAGRDPVKTAAAPPPPGGLTYERLLNSAKEPHNWLMYWGDYRGTHYSPLNSVNTGNVKSL